MEVGIICVIAPRKPKVFIGYRVDHGGRCGETDEPGAVGVGTEQTTRLSPSAIGETPGYF